MDVLEGNCFAGDKMYKMDSLFDFCKVELILLNYVRL